MAFSFLWTDFAFDTAGTIAMSKLPGAHFQFNLHMTTGYSLNHAISCYLVNPGLIKMMNLQELASKISVHVWAVWLIPYIWG